jgi:hypothetical protein
MLRGRCPVCSGELIIGPENTICKSGDFQCSSRSYVERWEQYEEAITVITEVLLFDLKELNKNKNEGE